MNFQALMAGVHVPPAVRVEIDRLLKIKTSTAELGQGARIPALEAFLTAQITWAKDQPNIPPDLDAHNVFRARADDLFREIIG